MADPFLCEIRLTSFGFAPKGWAMCNGQLLPINQNQAMFSLLGTTYGGNGQVNFGLPVLQGRMPLHMGNGHTLGERAGEQNHTLTQTELPQHAHAVNATTQTGRATTGGIDNSAANGHVLAAARGHYAQGGDTSLAPATVQSVGGSQAHLNMPPFLALDFIIALQGIFPSQN